MAKQTVSNNSALKELGKIPRVGSAFGGDISLGFSHEKALKIASDTLAVATESIKNKILEELLIIFNLWKNDHGVYPPNVGGLFGFLSENVKQEPARDYCERIGMSNALSGKKNHIPRSWECCPYVQTPIGLFWKLLGDKYLPLVEFVDKNTDDYEHVIAILILISNKPISEVQSSDCIDAALELAAYRLGIQEIKIKQMKPAVEAAEKRKRQRNLQANRQSEATEKLILSAYSQCKSEGAKPTLKEIAARTNMSESVISKCLRKNGFNKYNSK